MNHPRISSLRKAWTALLPVRRGRAILAPLACGVALAVAGSLASAQPLRIAGAEFIPFKTDKGAVLHAFKLTGDTGQTGACVGDPLRGMTAEKAAPLLEKLKGLDAANPEAAWDAAETLGLPVDLRRFVDIAVWDLYGRAQGKPVAALLGPAKRDRVKFYAAGFPNMTLEENVRAVKECAGRKIPAYKVYSYLKGTGPTRSPGDPKAAEWVAEDIALARALREAAPQGLALMFYNGESYSAEQALAVGAVLDELGYAFFYDPMPVGPPGAPAAYAALREKLATPLCGPVTGGLANSLRFLEGGAADMAEIDLYAGFTPCLRFVRACQKAGVPLDLHGGFPMDLYQFPLYGFVGDDVLPLIGWHTRSPANIGAPGKFSGAEEAPANRPWLKRAQARDVDENGLCRLVYAIPGMGLEPDWDWIEQHKVAE